MIAELIAIELVTLHMVDGRAVQVNPAQVTQLVHPHEEGNKQIVDTVHCVVRLADGSFVSVAEHCEEVQRMLEEKRDQK